MGVLNIIAALICGITLSLNLASSVAPFFPAGGTARAVVCGAVVGLVVLAFLLLSKFVRPKGLTPNLVLLLAYLFVSVLAFSSIGSVDGPDDSQVVPSSTEPAV